MTTQREDLITEVFEIAKGILEDNKDLRPSLFIIDAAGKRRLAIVDPGWFHDDPTKELFTHLLRDFLKRTATVTYLLAMEGWLARCTPPLCSDPEESLARYWAEYERRGWAPDHGGGRDEVLIINACERTGSTTRLWLIRRNPESGYMTELVPMAEYSEAVGRFINLFDEPAH
jgi:hypothetical protein